MAILKRASYERQYGKVSDIAYRIYRLLATPLTPSETQEERNKEIAELKKIENVPTNVGKYAIVKDDVFLPKDSLSQVHFHPYKIVNENRKKTWICLESKINVLEIGAGGTKERTDDRSFWMKASECNIYNG